MKKKELKRKLSGFGWWLQRQDGDHEVWTNGDHIVMVPRHREIKEFTARGILKMAAANTVKKIKEVDHVC